LLILGAQVLFGFQLHVVFQEGFARLNPATRLIDSVAQGLMAIAIGLLIAPSMHHLIAEKGQDTEVYASGSRSTKSEGPQAS
jgi:Family of unknown function (DUF6328)